MDSTYTVQTGQRNIHTTVTANADTVSNWIGSVNNFYRWRKTFLFGLDVEWKPNRFPGEHSPAATLQICAGNRCLIIQLIHISHFPRALRRFLRNPRYVFAGVDIRTDAEKLEEQYGLVVDNVYDVREVALEVSPERLIRWPGLQELARVVAGFVMEKPRRVTMSDWGAGVLSVEQIVYACLDAYASCRVGVTLYFDYGWA